MDSFPSFLPRNSLFVRSFLATSIAMSLSALAFAQEVSAEAKPQDSVQEEVLVVGDGSQVVLPEAYAGGQVARGGRAGVLGNLDMMDAPFSSMNFTEELIRSQQARSVADVLQNDPTVRVATGFGNFQELYMIRGFPVYSDDMTYNGLYGILPRQYVAAELLERVETFRGANSFVNGASPGGGSIGGSVNLVPKRAGEEPLTRLSTGIETGGQAFAAVDLARRFGADENTGVRINAVKRNGETSIEDQERELGVFSIGLDHQGERLRLSADIGYQEQRIDAPRPSVTPPADGIPKPPDAETNFAQSWNYTEERQTFGVARGEYDLTDTTTVWLAAGMREGTEGNILSSPTSDLSGDTTAFRFDNERKDKVYSGDTGLRVDFNTGSIGHRVTLSASYFSLESRNAWAFGGLVTNNIYNPYQSAKPDTTFAGGDLSHPLVTQETETMSYAVADSVSMLEDRLLVTLGARYQTIEQRGFDYGSGVKQSDYDESAVTPVAAAVYHLSEELSAYANYSEALIPGDIAPATAGGQPIINAGEVFAPYKSKQYEVGMKFDYENIGGTISLFSLTSPSSYAENNVYNDNGEQRNRGMEVSVFGQPVEGVRLVGGMTWLQTEMLKTQDGLYDGNDAIGVPETQLNLNAEWDVPGLAGLTLDARGVYTGSQYADGANDISVSSWHRFDAGARYTFHSGSKPVTLSARVQNLTNEDDWTSVGGYPGYNYLVLGAPRTLMFSASVEL